MNARISQRGFILMPVILLITLLATIVFLLSRENASGLASGASEAETTRALYVAAAGLNHAKWVADSSTCSNYGLPATPFGPHSYSAMFSPAGGSPITITATGTLAGGATRTMLSEGTVVYEAPTQTTYQPDAKAGQDAYIDFNQPTVNRGALPILKVRGGGLPRHSLLRFDLAAVPPSAKLVSAVLELNSKDIAGNGAIGVYRLTNGWLEGVETGGAGSGASWNERDGGEPWFTAGGDFHPAAVATAVLAAPANAWHQWDITSLLNAWIGGGAINNGLILIPEDTSIDATFHSSDGSDPELHPRLILTYACECGVGGTPGLITLLPGAAGADTYLGAGTNEGNNFGAASILKVNNQSAVEAGLLKFDMSKIPAGSTITSATLELWLEGGDGLDGGVIDLHRVTQAWVEGDKDGQPPPAGAGATYQSYDGQTNWANSGGDYASPALDSVNIPELAQGWHQWDVTSAAQDWATGSAPNDGVLLRASGGEVNKIRFTSGDGNAAEHPRLIVNFACACGEDCSVGGGGGAGSYCEADFQATSKEYDFDWAPGSGEVTGIDFLPEGVVVNGVTLPAGGGWITGDRNKDKFFVSDVLGLPLTEFSTGLSDPRGIAYVEGGVRAGHLAVADKSDDAVYFLDLDGSIVASFSTAGFTLDPYGLSFIGATNSNVYEDHLAISTGKDGGSVYLVDQSGVLKKSIDVDSYAPNPQGVAHLTGSDKLMVSDKAGLISIVDFNGIVLNQHDTSAWGFTETQGVTIHPATCEHVVIDKKALRIAGFGTGIPEGTATANLLMVVANPNNLSTQEVAKQALMESWAYTVTVIDDGDSASDYAAAVAANDVAFIGEDISANKLGNKLTDASIGVVTEEPNLSDELGLSTMVSWDSGSALNIDDNSHYITLPFATGPQTIFAIDANLAHVAGTLAPDLQVLGSAAASPMLVTLEAGATKFNALPSDGRRVQVPWGDSNFDLDNLTAAGQTILKRSLEWGVQPPPRCDADFAANNLVSQQAWPAGTGDVQGIDYLPPGLVLNGESIPSGGGWILSDKNQDRLFVTDLAGSLLTDFPMLAFDSQGVALIDAGQWIHYLAVADKGSNRVFYINLDGQIEGSFSTLGITTGSPLGISFIGATASGTYDSHLAFSSNKNAAGGGTATVYIVDQSGSLQKTIDVEAFAPDPQGVTHLNGADKLLVTDKDGMVSAIDFDGNLLHQYFASNFGLTQLTDVAINPMNCEHVIVDKNAEIIVHLDPNSSGSGGGPRYVEMYVPWNALTPDTWETKNLGVFGLPANAVAEIAILNADGGKELWGGVRAKDSTLERRLQLHEADGGGVDVMVMHVQTDSAGRIEHYSEDPDKLSFVLLGYWTEGTYVETWEMFTAGASASWQSHSLGTYGIGGGEVAEIFVVNTDGFSEHQAGVRTGGTSLARIVNLHEAKDGGGDGTSMLSVTDAGSSVDLYADDDASIGFYLLGHWSTPPGTYTEAFADLGTVSVEGVWEDKDLSSFGVPANAVAQIAPVNSENGAEAWLGVRAKGSGMPRLLELHESENGGDDLAAMHVNIGAGGFIQWYDDKLDKIHHFNLLGWWIL